MYNAMNIFSVYYKSVKLDNILKFRGDWLIFMKVRARKAGKQAGRQTS